MIRKLITSIMWDISDVINWVATELVCPEADKPKGKFDYPPDEQLPVGTVIYYDGEPLQMQANGRWQKLEQDGEPIEPLEERLAKAYEGVYDSNLDIGFSETDADEFLKSLSRNNSDDD